MAYSDVAIQTFAKAANFWIADSNENYSKTDGESDAENACDEEFYSNKYWDVALNNEFGPYL